MKNKKNVVAVVVLFLLTIACKKEETKNPVEYNVPHISNTNFEIKPTPLPANGKYAEMTFENQKHDFGTITQGDKVTYDFKFTNTGGSDLVITNAKGSCGCTVPEYPKDPIAPGEEGVIKVSFDSKGKIGDTSKSVTLLCNVKEGAKILYIKSNILPKGTN